MNILTFSYVLIIAFILACFILYQKFLAVGIVINARQIYFTIYTERHFHTKQITFSF